MPNIAQSSGFQRKIQTRQALLAHRAAARQGGQIVVHCHGCFDIVHPGHIRYLQFAKQQGDILVVSLTGDPHVGKGEGRPYVPQELRAENLAALEFVDHVYVNPDPTAVELLEWLKPDIYIKGREYEHNHHAGFLRERRAVESYGGRVIFSSGEVIYSSSQIIDQFAQRIDLEREKFTLFCRRYEITAAALKNILDGFADRPFTVVGDVILDRYQYCDAADISNDGPMMSLVPLEVRDYVGGAAILACHLAELGAKPVLIGSFGRDDASDRLIDTLESSGVHVLPMRNRKKLAVKTRFVVDTQKLFQLDDAPSTPTDSANERYLLDQIKKHGESCAALMLYDAGLGCITDSLAAEAVATARVGYGKVIGGTAGSRGRLGRLSHTDLLVGTERGLRIAMRDHEQGLSSLAYRLLTETSGRALALPLGKKGLLCFDEVHVPGAAEERWEGKLRSEYIAAPEAFAQTGGGAADRLGFDEALLAVTGGAICGAANVQQAACLGLLAANLQTRRAGHPVLDGEALHAAVQCL